MKTLQIQLKRSQYHYSITVGQGILQSTVTQLLEHKGIQDIFVITNDQIEEIYPEFMSRLLPGVGVHQLVLPDGEIYKNEDSIAKIYDFLARSGAHRQSLLVAFGGGVIGDMVGFAAATYMRGIPYLQIPTTLLSQVDSSIGGKTGYNHAAGKNFIGAFKQPFAVVIDIDFLKTLPLREFVAGYAELIKHAFIADAFLFQLVHKLTPEELKGDPSLLKEAIERSLEVKARIVEEDETERGNRAMLNFGHTLGHYIETFTQYQGCLHGEAVLAGMEFALWFSARRKFLNERDHQLMQGFLSRLGVRLSLNPVKKEEFLKILGLDKKVGAQGLKFVGLNALGQCSLMKEIQPLELWEAWKAYLAEGGKLIDQTIQA